MKKFDEELDEIFKTGLTLPGISEVDEDWGRMKILLKKERRKSRIINYTIIFSSVAALFLIAFSMLFDPGIEETGAEVDIAEVQSRQSLSGTESSEISGAALHQSPGLEKIAVAAPMIRQDGSPAAGSADTKDTMQDMVPFEVITGQDSLESPVPVLAAAPEELNGPSEVVQNYSEADSGSSLKGPESRFSLAVMASPDFSGVNSLNNTQIGYTIGLGLAYQASSKLGIEAGAAYGSKIYGTSFSNYKPVSNYVFPVKPYEVDAVCEVIDLQLNLKYKLFEKGENSVGLAAGLSSYFMLHENYTFRYTPGSVGPARYNVDNRNRHIAGIANISLNYRRSLGNNIDLAFRPYLKLPLTDIGYGNVRLKSAGISIGVITNLKTLKK